MLAVGNAVCLLENWFAVLGQRNRAGKLIVRGIFSELFADCRNQFALAQVWQSEFCGSGNRTQIEIGHSVRLGTIDFDREPPKLIRISLLYECRQFRGRGLFDLLEFEAAGHFAKSHFLVDVLGAIRQVLLEKIL